MDNYVQQYPKLFEYVSKLAGLPKSFGVHPCGKVLSQEKADQYNAIEYNADTDEWVLQGDMHTADDLGLVKCDFLGLRTLDVIYDILDMIGKDYNYIAPHKIDTSDQAVWKEFAEGHTDCIFQFESDGMKKMLSDMKCNCIENLSAANALYRPGAKAFIPNYVNRKNGTEEISYLHPDLEPILSNSYGIILFQEQLIEIGRLANLPNPDELRKATAKKKPELMKKIEPMLKQGLKNIGWTSKQCDDLWVMILDFARYSFNKCLSGSTTLMKSGLAKSKRNPTIEEMYHMVHDIQYAKDNNYLPLRSKYRRLGNYGTALSMFPDGKIHKNIVQDIQPAGERPVYRVTTESGKYIECTDNHKFPTPKGEIPLFDLSVGDELYILGQYTKCTNKYNFTNSDYENNAPKKGQIGFQKKPDGEYVKFFRYRDYCKDNMMPCAVCGKPYSQGVRFELHHNDKDRSNNNESNLTWCCVSCHKKLDYALGRTKVYEKGIPTELDKIVSIEYVRTEMTYDVTMADPAHNFVANNGIVTCNSHSSAYALTAYILMYLKVHHPSEFITACINSYEGDIDGIVKTVAEGKRMKIPFKYDTWRTVETKTMCKDGTVYLGLNTIKGFGDSQADVLHRISDKSSTFLDVLKNIKAEKGGISDTQFSTLINHNFFAEFGDSCMLEQQHQIFNMVYGKKIFKKNADLPISEDILRMFAKETDKQFRDIDHNGLFNYLAEHTPYKPKSMGAILNAELKDFGYILYTNPKIRGLYYVLDINTKYTPRVTLYTIQKGVTFAAKIPKKKYNAQPVCVGNLIEGEFNVKPKVMLDSNSDKDNPRFITVPNTVEYWVDKYRVVQ